VFILTLFAFTDLRWRECCAATSLAMAFAAVMFANATLMNALLRLHVATIHAASINLIVTALFNVAIVAALAACLRTRGVPVGRTLTLWMLAFNGSCAPLFFALHSGFLKS